MRKRLAILIFLIFPSLGHSAPSEMKKMAKDFSRTLSKAKCSSVALLVFRYPDGRLSSGSTMLSEQLGVDLGSIKGFRVIDRAMVRKKLRENNVAESMPLDEALLKKIGQTLEAQALIYGTLVDKSDAQSEVTAHVFHVETGEELVSGKSVIKRTWTDSPQYPRRP